MWVVLLSVLFAYMGLFCISCAWYFNEEPPANVMPVWQAVVFAPLIGVVMFTVFSICLLKRND